MSPVPLVQKFVAQNYKSVYPDYADKVKKNNLSFKNNRERNQYIINSYYNEHGSKSVGELAKELGISKSCISEVLKRQKDEDKANNPEHVVVYKRRKYIDQLEAIFNDRYGVNGPALSKQDIIVKYNLTSTQSAYSHMMKSVEDILIREGVYTAEEIKQIKQKQGKKNRLARLEKCDEIYHAYRGEGGGVRKSIVQLAMENHVAVSTIWSWINYYKKHVGLADDKNETELETEI